MAEEKDPTRVAAQLKRMIAQRKRTLWVPALFWLVPLAGVLVCWHLESPWWLLGLAVLAMLSGLISFVADVNQYYDWKKRLSAIKHDQANRPA